ncbi:hypothetical protein [Pseudidiomarina insulisalsae]|uniref:Uncharacterized protein n=1 Tax=Pseudidiomarina insulisalsae TaxID=575789 RepID=A0A432Y8R9_9GAMM|nr:hypothetical protein [Pseudidiomarina insulisalsae]RUO57333.1 hypothetical protein CWI71_11810 [Pseudidiomarina insulisalsae]
MLPRGFTTVWLLPVLAALMLLTLGVMRQSDKVQQVWYQQTIADNMAISAATLLAREMNLLAIMNRALLANQLTTAQLVGIGSWLQMMRDVADRSALISSWIPYLNAITRNIANAVRQVDFSVQQIIAATLAFQRLITTVLRTTQWYARVSFALQIPPTLQQIYDLHAPRHKPAQVPQWELLHAPGLVPVPWLWWTFMAPQRSGSDNKLAYKLVVASLDPFSQQRSYEWFDAVQVEVEKAGGVRLIQEESGAWSWQGMDTVSVHVQGLLDSDEYPWGDGATYFGSEIRKVHRKDFGYSGKTNPQATAWAQLQQHFYSHEKDIFRYFNRTDLSPSQWPQVIVRLPDATAKAGVAFSRPRRWFARNDNKVEQANLFNALWFSQLLSLSQRDRAVLAIVGRQDG